MALWFAVILYYIKKYTTISCRKNGKKELIPQLYALQLTYQCLVWPWVGEGEGVEETAFLA